MNFHLTNQVAAILLATNPLIGVDAHGYLKSPRSRNYHASINPIWSGGTATDPSPENCPHCLNIGGTEARCGKVGKSNTYLLVSNVCRRITNLQSNFCIV
jgi:predicted carbohydrate-binding protein with CBM5 and CBM33 domain